MKLYLSISALFGVSLALVGCSSSSGEASLESAPVQVTAAESKNVMSVGLLATGSPKDDNSDADYVCELGAFVEPVDKKVKITSTNSCNIPIAAGNVHFYVYEMNPEFEEAKLIADRREYGLNTDEVSGQVVVNCPSKSTLKIRLTIAAIGNSIDSIDSTGGVLLYKCSTGEVVAY